MTANPKPDTSALVAGVRAGNIESFSKLADYLADLIHDLATVESELSELSELRMREAALAAFVKRIADENFYTMTDTVHNARVLLEKLAEGKP